MGTLWGTVSPPQKARHGVPKCPQSPSQVCALVSTENLVQDAHSGRVPNSRRHHRWRVTNTGCPAGDTFSPKRERSTDTRYSTVGSGNRLANRTRRTGLYTMPFV